jgi:hypothetical protein
MGFSDVQGLAGIGWKGLRTANMYGKQYHQTECLVQGVGQEECCAAVRSGIRKFAIWPLPRSPGPIRLQDGWNLSPLTSRNLLTNGSKTELCQTFGLVDMDRRDTPSRDSLLQFTDGFTHEMSALCVWQRCLCRDGCYPDSHHPDRNGLVCACLAILSGTLRRQLFRLPDDHFLDRQAIVSTKCREKLPRNLVEPVPDTCDSIVASMTGRFLLNRITRRQKNLPVTDVVAREIP